jgi:hypothetical protein
MHKRTFVILVLSCLSGNYAGSSAQPRFQYPTEKLSLGPALYVQSWRIKDSTGTNRVSAIFTPLRLSIPVASNFDLDFYSASAFASLDQETSQTLNGLVDSKIRGTFRLNDYHWLVQVGVNLPTGKNLLAADEANVNSRLTETVLGFLIKRYGRGLDVDAGVAYAWSVSEKAKTALGVAYLRKGKYLFRRDDGRRFQPGDEFTATTGLEVKTERLLLRSNVLAKFFQKDRLGGRTAFQEGAQIEINGDVSFPVRKWRFALSIRDVIKADNKTFSAGGQTVAAIKDNFSGNIFWLNQQVTYPFSEKFSAAAAFGLNILGKSDLQLGDAQIINFGAGAQFKLSEHLIAQASGSYSTGEAKDAAAQTFDLRGIFFNTGLTLRY